MVAALPRGARCARAALAATADPSGPARGVGRDPDRATDHVRQLRRADAEAHVLHQLRDLAPSAPQGAPRRRAGSGCASRARGKSGMSGRGRSAWRGGESGNRLGERRIMIVFALLFLLIAGAAVLVEVLSKPRAPKAVCPKKQV